MKIKWTTVYVNDQEKALRFYTDTWASRRRPISHRALSMVDRPAAEDPDGAELILESNTNPAAKAYQEAMYGAKMRAAQFLVSDIQAEHDRLAAQGVKFTMPVTKVTGSIIAVLDDTCGNLIQLFQPAW